MSKIGTVTTVERIEYIDHPGSGEQSPGLVFRISNRSRLVRLFALLTRTTELRIDAHGLIATGELGGPRPGTLQLPWSRIREFHYAPGGAGEIGGLYAREGTCCSRCLLPCLTEPQADQIITTIAVHYPFYSGESRRTSNNSLEPLSLVPTSQHGFSWRPRWSILHEQTR